MLCCPAIVTLARYWADLISYGQVIHETGDWSIGLLCLALLVTPLRRIAPHQRLPQRLLIHRRAIGVASFGYAAIHTAVYLQRKWGYGYIQEEALQPELLTGWIALAIFLLLAATSNKASVRTMQSNWKRLHRFVYIAAGLSFGHWILTSLDPQAAYVSLAALCAVESLRFLRR